jgi:hypothetical protein
MLPARRVAPLVARAELGDGGRLLHLPGQHHDEEHARGGNGGRSLRFHPLAEDQTEKKCKCCVVSGDW